jgi:hypothetical protein
MRNAGIARGGYQRVDGNLEPLRGRALSERLRRRRQMWNAMPPACPLLAAGPNLERLRGG